MPLILPTLVESTDAPANAGTPYTLSVGTTAQGTISAFGDRDWYRVTLVAGQTYTFAEIGTGQNSLQDTYLNLHDSNGAIIAFNDDDRSVRIVQVEISVLKRILSC